MLLGNRAVSILDLDLEQSDLITMNGKSIIFRGCLCDFDVRIAIPVASKRPGAVFSTM